MQGFRETKFELAGKFFCAGRLRDGIAIFQSGRQPCFFRIFQICQCFIHGFTAGQAAGEFGKSSGIAALFGIFYQFDLVGTFHEIGQAFHFACISFSMTSFTIRT